MAGDNIYNVTVDLFTILNLCNKFEVGMGNPRQGLIVKHGDKVFRLEPVELVDVKSIEEAFKIIPNN